MPSRPISGQARPTISRRASPVTCCLLHRLPCSLPFVSPPVYIGDVPYLDGGIGDSIPVAKALTDGCKKAIVVLTQPAGYRKGETKGRMMIRATYGKYPEFAYSLECRNEAYNSELDLVDELEAAGKILVIRPRPQQGLKRLERDPFAPELGCIGAVTRTRDLSPCASGNSPHERESSLAGAQKYDS